MRLEAVDVVLPVAFCIIFGGVLWWIYRPKPVLEGIHRVSLSGVKQQSLAAIMYAADFDDHLPLGTAWHTGKDQLCFPKPVGCFATWAWSIQPYMKSSGLFSDPDAPAPERREVGQDNYDTLESDYGYNYNFLSPYSTKDGRSYITSVDQTSATAPEFSVMTISKWHEASARSPYYWGTALPGGMLLSAGVESPKSSSSHPLGWGRGGFFDQDNPLAGLSLAPAEGRYTGGVAFRTKELAVVGFLDGHVKKQTAEQLAVGTNWRADISAADVVVTNSKSYLWNVDK